MAFPDIQKAAEHLEREEISSALPLLTELVDRFPVYAAAHLLLARAYRMDGQRTAALEALAQAAFWTPSPDAIKRELHRIAGEQEVVPEERAPEGDAPVPFELALPGASPRALGGERPDELAKDLRNRLGPPAKEIDEDIEDLDGLIRQLEGARITPEPDFSPSDRADEPEHVDEDAEEVVSETLARIYATQKEYTAAAETYRELAEKYPERSEEFLQKAREMREAIDD